jgi:hypothetical protein
MSSQTVHFEYDPIQSILFATEDYELKTTNDVDAFVDLYRLQFERFGHPVYVVVKIDGLLIRKAVVEHYGRQAKRVVEQHCLGLARYAEHQFIRLATSASTRRAKFGTEIYSSREQAIAAIEQMKKQQK